MNKMALVGLSAILALLAITDVPFRYYLSNVDSLTFPDMLI
jgi:hypothetical protein